MRSTTRSQVDLSVDGLRASLNVRPLKFSCDELPRDEAPLQHQETASDILERLKAARVRWSDSFTSLQRSSFLESKQEIIDLVGEPSNPPFTEVSDEEDVPEELLATGDFTLLPAMPTRASTSDSSLSESQEFIVHSTVLPQMPEKSSTPTPPSPVGDSALPTKFPPSVDQNTPPKASISDSLLLSPLSPPSPLPLSASLPLEPPRMASPVSTSDLDSNSLTLSKSIELPARFPELSAVRS